jgi:Flp pilus assembly protein TadG
MRLRAPHDAHAFRRRLGLAGVQQVSTTFFPALKNAWRDKDGSALVEASLLTPLLVSLYFGVFDFSWYFYNQQLVEAGVRDAARYMARIELTNGNTNPCAQNDRNGVLYTTDAANIAVTAQTSSGTARVTGWTASDVTISCVASPSLSTGVYADGSASMTIISATTNFADPSLGFFALLGLSTPSLSFTHQERFIGPG